MLYYIELQPNERPQYDQIPMKAQIREIYQVKFENLDGITFHRTPVTPYEKDFSVWETFDRWNQQFDLSNWHFFAAFDQGIPVAGAVLCCHTPGVNMLDGRDDLGVLWDLRVDPAYQRQGVAQKLFSMVKEKAVQLELKQLKIECQNNNVPALHFYLKQGAQIGGVHQHAYDAQELWEEVQILLYLDLSK
ncbi:MAG: GNAT family N-acetyltransferase [Massiliimalia sp.]|jgi:ribosomal protein S18 acetylase RimI-like enzyme